jgi:hypothetical protein
MQLGIIRVLPMRLHSFVEMLVGPVLVAAGLFGGAVLGDKAIFFAIVGVAIVAVWLLSEYSGAASA